MTVQINFSGKTIELENLSTISYKKHRVDIQNLLYELKKGNKLSQFFKYPIDTHVRQMLTNSKLINENESLTLLGEKFLNYPYIDQNEHGLFLLNLLQVGDNSISKFLLLNAERKLNKEQQSQDYFNLNDSCLLKGSEFAFSEIEKGSINNVINLEKFKKYPGHEVEIQVNIDDSTYTFNGETYLNGEEFDEIARRAFLKRVKDHKLNDYDEDLNAFVVSNLSLYTDEELLSAKKRNILFDDLIMKDIPLVINDYEIALKYIYITFYNRIFKGKYFTTHDLNEVLQNELLPSAVFDAKIKDKLLSYHCNYDEFKKYLDKDRYSKLQYKLNIMSVLLGLNDEDNVDNTLTSYDDILDLINKFSNEKTTKKVYLLLGYPYVRNKRNKIVDCLTIFKKRYKNITIIDKARETAKIDNDKQILEKIKQMGVEVVRNSKIGNSLHDRFIVLEKDNNTYDIILCTTELGQFFSIDNGRPTGFIKPLANEEVNTENGNLIELMKGGLK